MTEVKSIIFRVSEKGNLNPRNKCPMKKIKAEECKGCPNFFGKKGFYGRIDKILCKGEKIENEPKQGMG